MTIEDNKISPAQKADEFLKEASQFQLGKLPTESRHPKTMNLSELCKSDLKQALAQFKEVDQAAIQAVVKVIPQLEEMNADILATLLAGGSIYLCGCGATGRLSISLEALWRQVAPPEWREKVSGFIAGGDFALVKSIENFEDHPEFGVKQLVDLGFTSEDLLIAITEGGETPFVIGAAQYAAGRAKQKPYFVFCNPPEILKKTAHRSEVVLNNPKVKSVFVNTGPMAISGSTRLQATTAQQLAVGSALFSCLPEAPRILSLVQEFQKIHEETDFTGLAPLIEIEAGIYESEEYCVHSTSDYGITVLTDTTERTPTFSLAAFESTLEKQPIHSWTYLNIPTAKTTQEAWKNVLGRNPKPLDWEETRTKYGMEQTLSYDFSENSIQRRRQAFGQTRVHAFLIQDKGDQVELQIERAHWFAHRPAHILHRHLLVKCALNMSSTLVMGVLGRIYGNVMVFVRPTNKKLIDRSIRYVQLLLEEAGQTQITYSEICHALFREMEHSTPEEPIVLKTFQNLQKRQK